MKNEKKLSKVDIIIFLREHKNELHDRFGITKIALFGSHARGDDRDDSDIDILFEMKEKKFNKQFELQEFLEKRFQKKIDLGTFESIHPFVMRFVEKDLIYA
jgi:predicted nucleotidyltransferase